MTQSPRTPSDIHPCLTCDDALAGVAQLLSVFVPDPDAHHDIAVAAGARIARPLTTEEYGARGYMALDPEGHGQSHPCIQSRQLHYRKKPSSPGIRATRDIRTAIAPMSDAS